MPNDQACCKAKSEYNPFIDYFKWLYRFCRRVKLSREYSIKEYMGFMFGVIAVTSLVVYFFAFLSATVATQISDNGKWLIMPSRTGPLGDTIGGLSSPVIGVIAAALSFLSFFMQYKANLGATKQFENTSIADDRDRFDRRLEALIFQNREIARNMRIFDLSTEKTINALYRELKLSIQTVRSEIGEQSSNADIINIGYAFFYLGIGKTSNTLILDLFDNSSKIDGLIKEFENLQYQWRLNALHVSHNASSMQGELYEIPYLPFDGHQTLLGHYFRSYYHVIKFAKEKYTGLFNFTQVYEKVKSLRTQTSVYEQILILTNSQTVFGADLIENDFIKDFKLTKNIPTPLMSFLGQIEDPVTSEDQEWFKISQRQKARSSINAN